MALLQIDEADHISLTSDGWTSDNNLHGFMSLTGHWIDSQWNRNNATLAMKSVSGSHTGEMIADTLSKELIRWKVTSDRQVLMLRDNASAMAKATELMKISSEPCLIHTLQLVIHDGLKEQRAVLDTLAVGRSIVGHFRHSSLATSRLEMIQRDNLGVMPGGELRVVQDVTTRWNSSLYMLERLIILKNAVSLFAAERDITTLNANQWDLAQKLVNLLRPFEEKTRLASRDTSSIGIIIPTVRSLVKFLEKPGEFGLGSMRASMLASLQRRFSSMLTNKSLLIATTLCPAYKLCWFQSADTKDLAKKFVVDEAVQLYNKSSSASASTSAATISVPATTASTGTSTLFLIILVI